MNSHDEPDWLEPDFDEPEPPELPDFAAAPAAPASTAIADPAAIAARLGWSLPPEALLDASRIGAMADLCDNDAMWPLILLQLRAAGAYASVPDEVVRVIEETTNAAKEAAQQAARISAAGAADDVRRAITRQLISGRKAFGLWGMVAGGAVFFIIFLLGFFLGNLSEIQSGWVLALGKFLGF